MSPPSPGSPAISDDEYPVFNTRQTEAISLDVIREQFGELQSSLESEDLLSTLNQQQCFKDVDKRTTRQSKQSTAVSSEKLLSMLKTSYLLNCSLFKLLSDQAPKQNVKEDLDIRFEKFKREMLGEVTVMVQSIKDSMIESVNESINTSIGNQSRSANSPNYSDIVRTPNMRIGTELAGSGRLEGSGSLDSGDAGITHELRVKVKSRHTEQEKRSEKSLCEPTKTVLVKGVSDYEKFVKHGYLTTKAFHKYFPNLVIKQVKPTKQGSLLLEMASAEDAELVVQKWEPHFLTNSANNSITTAVLLAQTGIKTKCVAENVDPSVTDEAISSSVLDNLGFKPLEVRRLKNRRGKPLPSVVLTFSSEESKDEAISTGLRLEHQLCPVRPYYERRGRRVNQCFNCFGFGHPACWCPKQRRCPHCSQDHHPKDCPAIVSEDRAQLKCPNCPMERSRNHSANSLDCPVLYQKIHHG